MEEVVAVEVGYLDGSVRFFLAWGRIQHISDPEPLAALVLEHARSVNPEVPPTRARVCAALREAAVSSSAPFFYECLLAFAGRVIPSGLEYATWRAERAAAMAAGQEIGFCGHPPGG